MAKCPCATHGKGDGDRHPSLRIAVGEDGKLLVKCRAGCDLKQLLHDADLRMEDLWPADGETPEDATAHETTVVTEDDRDLWDRTYTWMLEEMSLERQEHEELRRRGLDEDVIRDGGYASLGVAAPVVVGRLCRDRELGPRLGRVPGFLPAGPDGRLFSLAASGPGLLIPVRDADGRVAALKLRRRGDGQPRYSYLSGPSVSCGSPVDVPAGLFCGDPVDKVRVAEGELKARVATHLTRVPTFGLPGFAQWRRVVGLLERARPTGVLIAFDWHDVLTSQACCQTLCIFVRELRDSGFRVGLEHWDSHETYKGVDDLLAAGEVPQEAWGDDLDKLLGSVAAGLSLPPFPTPPGVTSAPPPAAIAAADDADGAGGERPGAGRVPRGPLSDPHRLARTFLQGEKLLRWRQTYWRFGGVVYSPLADERTRQLITRHVKDEFDRRAGAGKGVAPVECSLVNSTLQALQAECGLDDAVPQPSLLPGGEPRDWLVLGNGILDLAARELRLHTPDWFDTVRLPYEYDPSAGCPTWRAGLEAWFPGDSKMHDLLGEFFGYCLTRSTDEQKFVMLTGEGSNGKSVICSVLTAVLGEGNVSHLPLERFGDRFALASTIGKLANVASEVGELDKAAEGLLKAYVSGDRLTVDRKYRDPVEVTPTARLVFACNSAPRFADRTQGVWRRLLLIPCRQRIGEGRRVAGMDKPAWWVRSGELPGILNWALEGLDRLRKNARFTEPEASRLALQEYRMECDTARAFLEPHFEPGGASDFQPAESLYAQYRDWCERHGFNHPQASNSFGKVLASLFPAVERKQRTVNKAKVWGYVLRPRRG